MIFSYFLFPSTCFHCKEPLLKNTGICSTCFQALSLEEGKEESPCGGKIAWRGALFPPIDPLIDLLGQTLQKQHERMVHFFCALLVIQADRLGFPWCDALFFVTATTLSRPLQRLWQESLTYFFKAPMAPSRPDAIREKSTFYLIDWFVQKDEVYDSLIADIEMLYPHNFALLTLFNDMDK